LFNTTWFFNLTILWLLLSYLTLTLFDCLFVSDNWHLDFSIRLNQSDSIINLFNFFWTSTTYLSILFFSLTLLLILLSFAYNYIVAALMLLGLALLNTVECWDFLAMNLDSVVWVAGQSEVNLLLSNNLNKYHPLILYWSTFALVVSTLTLLSPCLVPYRFNPPYKANKLAKSNVVIFYTNFIALALGAWWALQEGTWGGWWNWDASEVLGLLVLLVTLLFVHKTVNSLNYPKISDSLGLGLLILMFSYFFLQLNFELTSHNFGSRFTYFFNNNLFFLESLFCCLGTIWWKIRLNILVRSTYISLSLPLTAQRVQPSGKPSYWIFWFMSISGFLIVILSFLPLLNYFFWRYLKINTLNSFVSIDIVVFFMVVSLLLLFSSFSLRNLSLYALLITLRFDFLLLLFFLTPLRWSVVSVLHQTIILFLLVNIWSYQFQLVTWINTPLSGGIYDGVAEMQLKQVNHVCNNFFIDKAILYDNGSFGTISYVNFFYKANSVQLNNFILYVTNTNAGSLFYNNFSWQSILMMLELLTWPNLNETLLAFFVVNLCLWARSLQTYKASL